jgi:hypothetical protein
MFKSNHDLKIDTPNGFLSFKGIQKITKRGKITLQLHSGENLSCSPNHRIKTISGWKSALELEYDDEVICKDHNSKIFHIEFEDGDFEYYDIVGVETSEFFSNDILSHNCEFLGSTNTLIHPNILSKLVFNTPFREQHGVKIYKEPIKDHVYSITVDVSEGLGQDSSSFVVVDCSTIPYELVATYKDANISQLLFPTLLASIGRYYNEASILVEVNIGSQVVNILHQDLEYENVVMTKMSGRKGTVIGGAGNQNRLGIKTTKVTKRIGCSNLKSIIEGDKIFLNDYDVINELSTYVVDGTSYNAEEGYHDDLVMCLVLFAWMVNQNYFKDVSNTDIRRRIVEEVEDDFTPFGIIDDGRESEIGERILSADEFERFLLN